MFEALLFRCGMPICDQEISGLLAPVYVCTYLCVWS